MQILREKKVNQNRRNDSKHGPPTVVTKEKFVVDAVDGHRTKIVSSSHKVKGLVVRVQETLCIESFEIDDFKTF